MADDRDIETGRRDTDPMLMVTDPRRLDAGDLRTVVTALRGLHDMHLRSISHLTLQLRRAEQELASARVELARISHEQTSLHISRQQREASISTQLYTHGGEDHT